MSSESKKLALWRNHTAYALEIALRDDSDDIELESSSSDNAFEMDENIYVDRFFGDSSDEGENGNAEYNR